MIGEFNVRLCTVLHNIVSVTLLVSVATILIGSEPGLITPEPAVRVAE